MPEKMKGKAAQIGWLYSVCLVFGFFAFFYLKSQVLQEIAFLGLAIPAWMQVRCGLARTNIAVWAWAVSFCYTVPLVVSFVFKLGFWGGVTPQDGVVLANLFFAFFIAALCASDEDGAMVRRVARGVFWLAVPLFVFVFLTQRQAYQWGRWMPYDMQPNWWGMMVLGACWGGLLLKDWRARAAVLTVSFLYMVELQARGSIVALFAAFVFASGFVFPLDRRKILWGLGLGLFALCGVLVAALSGAEIFTRVLDYVLNDVFLINDVRRGVGTGMSGRAEGYAAAWEAFLSSPLVGRGVGDFGFVHNGFLLVLAEGGVLAFAGMFVLLARAWSGLRRGDDAFMAGVFLSYIAAILTFPRTFNINMAGMLFMFVVMRGCLLAAQGKNGERRNARVRK